MNKLDDRISLALNWQPPSDVYRSPLAQYPEGHPCATQQCKLQLIQVSIDGLHLAHSSTPGQVDLSPAFSLVEDENVRYARILAWLQSLHAPAPVEQACACGCC